MEHDKLSQPPVKVVFDAPPSNSLGVAGVIVSSVGILTFGLLSPIGLLLSFFGLFRPPRGTAIAGVIIGLFGSCLFAAVAVAVLAFFTVAGAHLGAVFDSLSRLSAAATISRYYEQKELLPDDQTGNRLLTQMVPLAGQSLRYTKLDDQHFEIRSAGHDQAWQTADDIVTAFDVDDLKQHAEDLQQLQQALPPVAAPAQELDQQDYVDDHGNDAADHEASGNAGGVDAANGDEVIGSAAAGDAATDHAAADRQGANDKSAEH